MKKKYSYMSLWVASIFLVSFVVFPKRNTCVYLIGDSTMSNKKVTAFPETGWGMAFAHYFDETITLKNEAQNGRSTQSFIAENRWQPIVDALQAGDYVLIEFGHNDEKIDKPNVGTTLPQFTENLTKFVVETRAKNATPILLTPLSRRSFTNGLLVDTHGQYAIAVRQLAIALQVPMIDMLKKSEAHLIMLGDVQSKQLFNYVDSGHTNYPYGKKDDTHFSPLGAKKMASFAAEGLQELGLPLASHLLQ